jgi:hypothetical protein
MRGTKRVGEGKLGKERRRVGRVRYHTQLSHTCTTLKSSMAIKPLRASSDADVTSTVATPGLLGDRAKPLELPCTAARWLRLSRCGEPTGATAVSVANESGTSRSRNALVSWVAHEGGGGGRGERLEDSTVKVGTKSRL